MGCSFPILFLVLMVAIAHAALSPQEYWKSITRDTPMPAAVRDLLIPDVGFGLNGVSLDGLAVTQVGKARATNFYQLKGLGMERLANAQVGRGKLTNFYQLKGLGMERLANAQVGRGRATNFYQMKGLGMEKLANAQVDRARVSNFYQLKGLGTKKLANVQVGRARATNFYQLKGLGMERLGDSQIDRARATNFYQHKGPSTGGLPEAGNVGRARATNFYQKGVGVDVFPNRASASVGKHTSVDMADGLNFFLEKDLSPGAKMRLDFSRSTPAMAFIPRELARSIPFSSNNLPAILSIFSVQPDSAVAEIMKMTLQDCEGEGSAEEKKYCPTSLESMVDFSTSTLGTHDVRAVSSEFTKGGAAKQEFAVAASSPVHKLHGSRSVACHPQPYPHAVFYCHVTQATRAYIVPLVGVDEATVDAIAVCHADTSTWSPSHPAFQVLKVKPGTVAICHFLPQGSLVWARKEDVPPVSVN